MTSLNTAVYGGALRDDFGFFVYKLWAHLNLPVPTEVQLDISTYLESGPRRRMVKAFRGVGKSWLTAAYVLWRLYRDVNERILVISASKDRADNFTVFVRKLIEECPFLKFLKPTATQRDSVVSFDVAGSEPHQSPSVKSAGITGQITGSRATLIVADDIETPANSLTQMLRERLAEQVKEFDAILLPGGEVVYLGTDQTEMSLYKELPSRGYEVRVWPARVPLSAKLRDYGEQLAPLVHEKIASGRTPWEPMDPERFHEEDLQEREASYGRSGFAMQFMLDPSLGDLERFPLRVSDLIVADIHETTGYAQLVWGSHKDQVVNDLDCVGLTGDKWHRAMHAVVGTEGGKGLAPEFTGSVMFIDPAGRGKDETGYACVKSCLGLMYATDVGGFAGGYDMESLRGLALAAQRNKVNLIIVEPNFGDGMFNKLLEPVLKTIGYPCTVEDSERAKGQKELRVIDTLEPLMNQHKLVIDRKLVEQDLRAASEYECGIAERPAYQLFFQMTRLTRERGALRHDDRLEALAGACHYYTEQAGRLATEALDDLEEERRAEARQEFLNDCNEMPGTVQMAPGAKDVAGRPNTTGIVRPTTTKWSGGMLEKAREIRRLREQQN